MLQEAGKLGAAFATLHILLFAILLLLCRPLANLLPSLHRYLLRVYTLSM